MAGYIGPIPVPQATQTRETFTATASQTTFNTAGYQPGYLDVFMNGVKLIDGSDYTATNGSDVVLSSAAAVNDLIEVVAYTAFEVLNQNFTGTTTVADLTVTGDLTVDGTTTTINSTTLNVDDINITVASGAADAAAANGAGLTVDGANATFNYASSGDKWTMNKDLDITGDLFVPSGNLLVGKSTSTATTEGVELRPNGLIVGTRSGDYPLQLRRLTDNGDIIQFRQATNTVGSIGVHAGDYLTIGEGASALIFNVSTASVRPWNMDNTTSPDGVVNLGATNGRFDQLHLSGATYYGLVNSSQFIVGKSGADNRIWDRSGGNIEFLTGDLQRFIIKNSEVVVNDDSYDVNFRVESQDDTHAIFVDAALNQVTFFTNTLPIMGSASVQGVSIGNDSNAEMRILNTTTSPNMWLKKQGTVGTAVSFYKDSAAVGTIYVNAGSVSYNTTSDYRLKENVVDLTGGIDRVKQLQPRRFNFIADETNTLIDGFIAHEVDTVVPEAVTGEKDAMQVDESGNTVIKAQEMDASKLVPLLTAALQEAITKIEDLEARVAALET